MRYLPWWPLVASGVHSAAVRLRQSLERWAAAKLLRLVALTTARAVLLVLFEFFLCRPLGVAVPSLAQDVVSALAYLLAVHLATGADLQAFLARSAVLTLVLRTALKRPLGRSLLALRFWGISL